MQKEQTNDHRSSVIEDLTVDDMKTENVKGGQTAIHGDHFSFGVEREMKESGEKGGTASL